MQNQYPLTELQSHPCCRIRPSAGEVVEVPSHPRDVAVGGSACPTAGVAYDLPSEIVVEPVEVELQHPVGHLRHNCRRQRDLVRVAAHERDPVLVGCAGHGVPAENHPAAVGSQEVNDSAAREVATDSMEHYPCQHLCLLLPDCDNWARSLEPFPVRRLHVYRHTAESVRPFDLHSEHVRM